MVSIKSKKNGKYIKNCNDKLEAGDQPEIFEIKRNLENNRVSIKATKNGKYLKKNEENFIKANSDDKNESFYIEENSDKTFSIIYSDCYDNTCEGCKQYVNSLNSELKEKFYIQKFSDKTASFISHTNNMYITVDDQDNSFKPNLQLEKFYIIKNFDGTVSFKDKEGRKNIIIGAYDYLIITEREDGEKFHPINNFDNTVSFKLSETQESKYISVSDQDSLLIVKAVEKNNSANERFYLYSGNFFMVFKLK